VESVSSPFHLVEKKKYDGRWQEIVKKNGVADWTKINPPSVYYLRLTYGTKYDVTH